MVVNFTDGDMMQRILSANEHLEWHATCALMDFRLRRA